MAGGITDKANISKLDLNRIVKSGDKIVIPSTVDEYEENNNSENSSKIDINKATKEELMNITGIGEKTAEKIINYRDENGEFKNIEDIKEVNGIGESKYNNIKDIICID